MLRTIRKDSQRVDQGFTLVELLVYSVLMIVVMGIAASLFIRILETQQEARLIADQNNEAQVTFAELERDLRNASWAEVDYTGDLLILQSRIAADAGDAQYVCVGYFFDEASGELRRTQLSTSAETAAAIGAADLAAVRAISNNWTIVRDGMDRAGTGAVVFGPVDREVAAPETVSVQLRALTDNGHKPVELSKSISLRPQGGVSVGCGS